MYRLTYHVFVVLICYTPVIGIFLPETNFGAGIPDFDAVRLFSFLMLLTAFVETTVHRKIILFHSWILILFLFSLFVFVSVAWSQEHYSISFFQNYFDWVFIRLIIAILAINVFQHYANIKYFYKHVAICVSVMAIVGIVQFFLGLTEATGTVRAFGTFGGPNGFAVFLVLSVPSLLLAMKEQMISRRAGILSISLIICGVLSTVSRKGILGLLLSFLIYMMIQKDYKKVIVLLIAGFFSGIALFSTSFMQQRFERFQKAELEKQVAGRAMMAYAGVQMFMESPIIGLGFKGYNNNFSRFFPESSRKNYDAHNEFATALANYGIIGFSLFCLIFLYPIKFARNQIFRFRNGENTALEKNIAAVCIATTIPLMVSFYFSGAMFYINQYVTSFYYAIVAISFFRQEKEHD